MDKRAENLLIVDDNELLAFSMRHYLERTYRLVVTATTGDGALQELRQRPYGKVILDINLPDMDGLDLLNHIKQNYPATSVIIMTSDDFEEIRANAVQRGASGFFGKPFEVDALQGLIDNASV